MGDSLGDRMKRYEGDNSLLHRTPVVIRVDGRAFHTFARRAFGRHYSVGFVRSMTVVAEKVAAEMQGCKFAFGQSDEISFLLTDYTTIRTQAWFDYDLSKVVSISAAAASAYASQEFGEPVMFDSRAFNVPQDDVCNYFLWRQQDATRNAIQMLGREHFSHREMHKKNTSQIQEMVWQKAGVNFNDLPPMRKRGYCIVDGELAEPPIFSKCREFVEQHVYVRED